MIRGLVWAVFLSAAVMSATGQASDTGRLDSRSDIGPQCGSVWRRVQKVTRRRATKGIGKDSAHHGPLYLLTEDADGDWVGRMEENETPGFYRIRKGGTLVSNTSALGGGRVDQLQRGTIVNVTRIELFEHRVRAKIEKPPGWISIVDIGHGFRWAKRLRLQPKHHQEAAEPASEDPSAAVKPATEIPESLKMAAEAPSTAEPAPQAPASAELAPEVPAPGSAESALEDEKMGREWTLNDVLGCWCLLYWIGFFATIYPGGVQPQVQIQQAAVQPIQAAPRPLPVPAPTVPIAQQSGFCDCLRGCWTALSRLCC